MSAWFRALPAAVFCLLLGHALPGARHLSAARLPSRPGPSAARPQTAPGVPQVATSATQAAADLWKVRLIEEGFHHLMFDMAGA